MKLLFNNDRVGEYPNSWYHATAQLPHTPFEPLNADVTCDVCIIGGGYSGLSTALHLAKLGLSCRVLETHRIGFGASGRNGGQVGTELKYDPITLEKMFGKETATILWRITKEASQLVKTLIETHKIPCHLRDGIVYPELNVKKTDELKQYCDTLARDYGCEDVSLLEKDALHHVLGTAFYPVGVFNRAARHVHPLNLTIGVGDAARTAGAHIHEHSHVNRVVYDKHTKTHHIHTQNGTVSAQHVVYATNGYHDGLHPKLRRQLMPINNFIVTTAPLGDAHKNILPNENGGCDGRFVVRYWRRTHDDRLLFGGGENYGYRFPKNYVRNVRKAMLELYPQLYSHPIAYHWGGTLAITMNRLPNFEKLSQCAWTIGGYSGQGVAMSILSGKILAHAISGDVDDFETMHHLQGPAFPLNGYAAKPLLYLALFWYGLRDRLGI